jgi:hypothetical protein
MTEPFEKRWRFLDWPHGHYVEINDVPRGARNLLEWAVAYEKTDRHVAEDRLATGVRVSTVFLGLDHSFLRRGEPILYETMVFGGPHDEHQRRYSTRAEAAAGHYETLRMVQGEELAS